MRKFGTDAPEFMAFTLGESEKVYKIPLAASLPVQVLINMNKSMKDEASMMEVQLDFLRKYIGDAADTLTAGDVGAIWKAWSEESTKQGATVGESEALPEQ